MSFKRTPTETEKPRKLRSDTYYQIKDIQQKLKLRYSVIKAIGFRAILISFVIFNIIVSYWFSFKTGYILSGVLLLINSIQLTLQVLIIKRKVPKIRKCFQKFNVEYFDYACMFLVLIMFLILLFSIINIPYHWKEGFPTECKTYDNSCARLAYDNQYRTNKIQNKYALTFRNVTGLDKIVDKYMENTYGGWYQKLDFNMPDSNYTYLVYSVSNFIGIINDVAIKIDSCRDVWSTTSISIQSQLRLGLKDYGSNYNIIEGIIYQIGESVDSSSRNYLYCKAMND